VDPTLSGGPSALDALLGRFSLFQTVSAHLAFPPAILIQNLFN
jgi:hypothetical protein